MTNDNGPLERLTQRGLGRRVVVVLALAFLTIGCDRAAKDWARRTLREMPPRSYLAGSVRLVYLENPGAFLGLGGQLGSGPRFWLFCVGTGVMLVGLGAFVLGQRDMRPVETAGFALILGGGLGNLVDRASAGRVVDFLNVGIGSLRSGVFNVADLAIMLGVTLMFVSSWRGAGSVRDPGSGSRRPC